MIVTPEFLVSEATEKFQISDPRSQIKGPTRPQI